jgi:hypothetical protein
MAIMPAMASAEEYHRDGNRGRDRYEYRDRDRREVRDRDDRYRNDRYRDGYARGYYDRFGCWHWY